MADNWQRWVLGALRVGNHPAEAVEVTDLAPWYRRIRLSAPAFLRDLSLYPTIWIRLWTRRPDNPSQVWQRAYTLVDPDPATGTFALDFVLHEPDGPATAWAREATVGARAEIAITPRRLTPDPTIGTYVLAGDATALPAINSLLQYLPASTAARVFIEDGHPDHATLPLARTGNTEVTWLDPEPDRSAVAQALHRAGLEPGGVYVWAAGERAVVRGVRAVIKDLGLSRDRQHTQTYWIRGRTAGGGRQNGHQRPR